MQTPQKKATGWLTDYASGLRFPYLLALTVTLFLVDLFVPDFIPFADEVLLGLLAILLSRLKKRPPARGSEVERAEGTSEGATGKDGRAG